MTDAPTLPSPENSLAFKIDDRKFNIEFPLPDGRTLVHGPLKYASDGLYTRHYAEFINDPQFAKAYKAGIATIEKYRPELNIAWRVHVALWVAAQVINLDGDFVECGVYTGILSRAIVEYLDFGNMPEKQMWLLDTYEGIPAESLTAEEKPRRAHNKYHDSYKEVCETFRPFPNVHVVRGAVPGTLSQVTSKKVAYLSIDMNAWQPEIAAADFFWDKLVPGAIMLLDDYGWRTCEAQRLAFDKFAAERGVMILALPTGQGIIMKPLV